MGRELGIFPQKKLRIASEWEKVLGGFLTDFVGVQVSKNKHFLDGQSKLLWPWPLPLYFDIENHCILSQKSVLDDGDSQYWSIQT